MTGIDKQNRGLLVLVSSPSGGGKTTVIRKLLKDTDFKYSVSMTTRQPRNGELDGVDYCFISKTDFEAKIKAGMLLEHENVHGHYYGTPVQPVREWLKNGSTILFDVDVKGAMRIREQYPDRTCLIFLMPPNLETLKQRLRDRSTESSEQIAKRLQRVEQEMQYSKKFEHIIINNDLDETVKNVRAIINQSMQHA